MPRLPQRRRDRASVRHDRAGPTAKLLNLSPYCHLAHFADGPAGRDPVFFAQLASETETFHPESSAHHPGHLPRLPRRAGPAPDADRPPRRDRRTASRSGATRSMPCPIRRTTRSAGSRTMLRSARDGVSCTTCHTWCWARRTPEPKRAPSRRTPASRRGRSELNPGLTGFAAPSPAVSWSARPTSSTVRSRAQAQADEACHRHRARAHHGTSRARRSARAAIPCTCRCCIAARPSATPTSRRPIRSGRSAPTAPARRPTARCRMGAGAQGAVLPGLPHAERIARGIRIAARSRASRSTRNFPQAEHTLPPEDIDLPVREGFARHTLVGLNVFLMKMAQQFPRRARHPHRRPDADGRARHRPARPRPRARCSTRQRQRTAERQRRGGRCAIDAR